MQGMILSKVLNMSLMGSYCILVVLLVRLFLKKFDRKYTYYLWFVVFLNLCIPFSVKGSFSLIPQSVAEFSVPATESLVLAENDGMVEGNVEIGKINVPINNSISIETHTQVNGALPVGETDFENGEITESPSMPEKRSEFGFAEWLIAMMPVVQTVWLMGIAAILMLNLISVRKLRCRIASGKVISYDRERQITELDSIDTPFLWGIFRPMIYLPVGMDEQERHYIVAHESYHKHRKDHLAKIIVFAVVMLHWFNPLVWVAYTLFCRDMEISCDEAVLSCTEENIKKQYAESLLKYAAKQNGYVISPLTFGEPSVKARIKNVLRFQKKGIILSGIAFILVLCVVLGLIFRPKTDVVEQADTSTQNTLSPVETEESNEAEESIGMEENSEGSLPLLDIMQNASGYSAENYEYVDMDHDGKDELIGIFESENWGHEVWYCSSDGETCVEVPLKLDLEACSIEVIPYASETHVVINEYNVFGNMKQCTVFKLEGSEIELIIENNLGYIDVDDAGNILLTIEAYDGMYDPDLDMHLMHTWKATYLFYDGTTYKQYVALPISEEEFLQFKNAEFLRKSILEEKMLEDTEKIEFSYFKRSNNILHIQCAQYERDGFINYFYYTVKYEGETIIPDLSDFRHGQMGESFSNPEAVWVEETAEDIWQNKYIVGEAVNPGESGWNLEEITDVRKDFDRMSYVPEPGTEDVTYLLAEEASYTLYGKGDYRSMLLACDGQYAEIGCHYASNYMCPVEIREQDYDEDGETELAIKVSVMHGTGVYVDSFFMADRSENGEITVYQFLDDYYLNQLTEHISFSQTEQGIQAYIDGVEAGREVPYTEEELALVKVTVGEQIRFDLTGEEVVINAELGFYCDCDSCAVANYNDCAITAMVSYRDGGIFELTGFDKKMLDR